MTDLLINEDILLLPVPSSCLFLVLQSFHKAPHTWSHSCDLWWASALEGSLHNPHLSPLIDMLSTRMDYNSKKTTLFITTIRSLLDFQIPEQPKTLVISWGPVTWSKVTRSTKLYTIEWKYKAATFHMKHWLVRLYLNTLKCFL